MTMPPSPSLAARAEVLLNRLVQVEAQEADRQAKLAIENARQRADRVREALTDALDVIPVLTGAGVTRPPMPSQTLSDLAAARRTLRTAATAIVGAPISEIASRVKSNSVNQALETAEKTARQLDSALNRSVEKKRQEILPPGIDKPLIPYPGASYSLVAKLERLQTQLQRKVENLAPSDLAQRLQDLLRAAETWTAERPGLDEGLDRQDPEVRDFLRQAASPEGVPWPQLTPVVQAWLADPENTANLRIVLRR
jgi:hypothetical protein